MKKTSFIGQAVDFVIFYWWAILLVIIGFAVAYRFVPPAPPRQITIATGAENGGYHRFGMQLKTALEKKGLKVTLRPTAGTIENLKLLSDNSSGVSVAFGQGGAEQFYEGDKDTICGLGSLFYEPLWIFYRRDCNLTNFSDFKRLKVAIGKNDSGTQMLSKVLMRENNIPESSWVSIGSTDAIKALQENKVQALFLVAPVNDPMDSHKPHPDVYRLMADPQLALYPAKRAQAYVSRLPHLAIVKIGEGLLDLEKNYPPETETLISPLGTLLCRDDLNGDIAVLILETCRQIQDQGTWLEKAGEFPSRTGVTFPLLPEAKQFYDKGPSFFYKFHLPFWVANMFNRLWIMLIPLLTLVIPLVKLALPAYRWRIRRKIATKYRFLISIDNKLNAGTLNGDLDKDIDQLKQYEDELSKLHVPVMFTSDLFTLRNHALYLRKRLEDLKAQKEKRG